MEDTSGSASPALLRGRTGRATLGPGCPRERHPVWPADPSLPGRGPCGGIVVVLESPASAATVSRREVSEQIGLGSSRLTSAREGATVAVGRGFGSGRTWPVKPRLVVVDAGIGLRSRPGEGQRHPCSVQGDQAVSGRARGSIWLQKSTSGARSRPKGHGSSSLAPRVCGRAPRAKTRRKPGRGGEGHLARAAIPVAGSP